MANRTRTRLFREPLNPHFGYYYTVKKTLHKSKTQYQDIELIDTDEFGHVLLLDRITQVAEKNDWQYHEPMVHPAMCSHPRPRDVLVIGGGDGGILREVLRYPTVRRVVFAELDEKVVAFSREYLASINHGAFEDKRVQIHFTDGRAYVEKAKGEFDVVIMDMTDPFGPSRMLYTREFFRAVKRSFRDSRGMFVMHSESPVARPVAFNCILKTLGSVFGIVRPVYLYIQMYAVLWSIAVCSDATDIARTTARTIDARRKRYKILNTHVYTGATHGAMLTAYPYIEEILRKKGKIITDGDPRFPDHFDI